MYMNKKLCHEVEKYIYSMSWHNYFDMYLIHLNLSVDIYQIYPEETNVLLYKYYLYTMIRL